MGSYELRLRLLSCQGSLGSWAMEVILFTRQSFMQKGSPSKLRCLCNSETSSTNYILIPFLYPLSAYLQAKET